jgi:uncharacterized alpha-E superfamily protein
MVRAGAAADAIAASIVASVRICPRFHAGQPRCGFRAGPTLASHAGAANEIRNRLSNDHWRTILAARNDFRDAMQAACPDGPSAGGAYDRSKVLAALEHLSMQLGAISGAQGDRMARDAAWRLVFIGRHIERLGTLALFLEVAERSGALYRAAAWTCCCICSTAR